MMTSASRHLPHVRFADLTDYVIGSGERLQHVSSLFSPNRNMIGLIKQFLCLFGLVQMRHQLRLQVVLDVVDQEVHHGLGHRVLNGLPHDVKVRLD